MVGRLVRHLALLGVFVAGAVSATDFDSITLEQTVGTDPSECAASSEIKIAGDAANVIYCFRMTNHSGRDLLLHALAEEQSGTVFSDLLLPLGNGESMFYTMTAALSATTRSRSRWAAFGNAHFSCDMAEATVYLNDMEPGEWLFRSSFDETLDCKDVFD